MKKTLLFVLALGVMASCAKSEFQVEEQVAGPEFEVIASIEEAATRTSLTSDFKVNWSANDAISVFNYGEHYKFNLNEGAGQAAASFKWDPCQGTVSGGIDAELSVFTFVGTYPFNEKNSVEIAGEDIVINTAIATTQNYAEGSFGVNANPMVGVNFGAPKFSFKNVGTVLAFPIKGTEKITSVVVESNAKNIAGDVAVTFADENIADVVVKETGSNKVVLGCEGVQLNAETATEFIVVIAPGTYEANELTIKFYDEIGNYYQTSNASTKTYERSKAYRFNERTFEVTGVEEVDLWVKANAGAYMTAERIIPTVDNLNVEAWVKNLYNQPNTQDLLEKAATYIVNKNFDAAFDILGGIPGFTRDYQDFRAVGTFYQKVDYTGKSYVDSMLDDIEKVNDVESLIAFLNEFESLYEATGIKNKLDATMDDMLVNLEQLIEDYVNGTDTDVDQTDALTAYKNKISEQLTTSINGCNGAIGAIDIYNNTIGKWTGKKKGLSERAEMAAFVADAEALKNDLPNLSSIAAIEERVKAIHPIEINVADLVKYSVAPESFLTGADAAYEEALKNLVGSAKNVMISTLEGYVADLKTKSIVGELEAALENPDSLTSKFILYLFSENSMLPAVKESLREIVTEIENASKDNIDGTNATAKNLAIATATSNALLFARQAAVNNILSDLEAVNYHILNDGAWVIFKKILNWNEAVDLFAKYDLMNVYNALVELTAIIDDMITYTRGSIYYDIVEFADYQQNIDWWIVTFAEEI